MQLAFRGMVCSSVKKNEHSSLAAAVLFGLRSGLPLAGRQQRSGILCRPFETADKPSRILSVCVKLKGNMDRNATLIYTVFVTIAEFILFPTLRVGCPAPKKPERKLSGLGKTGLTTCGGIVPYLPAAPAGGGRWCCLCRRIAVLRLPVPELPARSRGRRSGFGR